MGFNSVLKGLSQNPQGRSRSIFVHTESKALTMSRIFDNIFYAVPNSFIALLIKRLIPFTDEAILAYSKQN
jgi:hypothetical protein